MTYTYYYQTKDNENRTGTIKARDRADAYTQLRKQGIRPYRVAGDDPFNWRPWAVGLGGCLLLAGLAFLGQALWRTDRSRQMLVGRRQITGDAKYLMEKSVDAWDGVFETKLDRYLAAYAQPGDAMIPFEATEADCAAFTNDLARTLERSSSDRTEVSQLKDILEKLRDEMRNYLTAGGTVHEYLDFLETRQEAERAIRRKAFQDMKAVPPEKRARVRLETNLRLQSQNLAPLP